MKKSIFFFLFLFSVSTITSETIQLGTLNWAPYCGEKLPEEGFFSVICREAFKRGGYATEIHFIPWLRAMEMARRGGYDGVIAAYYNESRNEDFYFSDPIYQSREVFICKRGIRINYTSLNQLKSYKIGVIRGYSYTSELLKQGFDTVEYVDHATTLKLLDSERVDLVIIERNHLEYLLSHEDDLKSMQDNFAVLDPPYDNLELHCIISRKREDGAEIIMRFNKGLEEMKADGTYNAILKRFGIRKSYED